MGTIVQLGFVYVVSVLHKFKLGYKIWFEEGATSYFQEEKKKTSKREVTPVRQRYVLGHQVATVLLDWNRPVGRHFRAARPSSHPHILGSCVRIFGLVAHHHPVENACAYLYCNFVLERLSVLQITAGSWRSLAFSCCTLASLCV